MEQFEAFVAENHLFGKKSRLLLAVSGGIDSVVLLHLLHVHDYEVEVAHCNFCLRGADADGDAHFVQALAESYGYTCHQQRFDTQKFAQERGISTQMAARELRYKWLFSLLEQQQCDYLLTAHHADDQLETVLLNWVRGTGLTGLSGIKPKKGKLVRPLLFAAKSEIEEYARQNALKWREDASNQSDRYRRNALRHHVMPKLKALNPNLLQTAAETIEQLQQTEKLVAHSLQQQAQAITKHQVEEGFTIDANLLQQQPAPLLLLHFLLKPLGASFRQVKAIHKMLEQQPGSTFSLPEHQVWADRLQLIVIPKEDGSPKATSVKLEAAPGQTTFLKGIFQLEMLTRAQFKGFGKDRQAACFDADRLQFPIHIRTWQEGDRMRPLGMQGHKKVSDLLIDAKVPLPQKGKIPVLETAGRIIWVVGIRQSEYGKVTEATERICRIWWQPFPSNT